MKNKRPFTHYLEISPIAILIVLFPILAIYIEYPNYIQNLNVFNHNALLGDLFYISKQYLLYIICFFMIIVLIFSAMKHNFSTWKIDKSVYFLIVFAFMAILSTFLSEYVATCLKGFPEQNESLFVLLCYLIIFVYTYLYVTNRGIKSLLPLFIVQILLVSFLCLMQLWDVDLYEKLFASKVRMESFHEIYGCFINPDYLAMYILLVFPALILLVYHYRNNTVLRTALGICILILIFSLFKSKVRFGILLALFELCFAIFLYILNKKVPRSSSRKCIVYSALFSIALLGIIVLCVYIIHSKGNYRLQSLATKDDGITFTYDEQTYDLSFGVQNNSISASCIMNEGPLDYTVENQSFVFTAPSGFHFVLIPMMLPELDSTLCFELQIGNSSWYFTNDTETQSYYYIDYSGEFVKIDADKIPNNIFAKVPSLFSGRGFIWAHTLPMLKKNLLVGSGPDTYAYYFPNDDYFSRNLANLRAFFTTKPHNLYLQVFCQEGGIALLALLAFLAVYVIRGIRILVDTNKNEYKVIVLGLFCVLIAYLINDSCIALSPFISMMFGISLAQMSSI